MKPARRPCGQYERACVACGAALPADPRERTFARVFCCQARTARPGKVLPAQCWITILGDAEDTRAALIALPKVTSRDRGEKQENLEARGAIVLRYIREVGAGEPPLSWYRSVLKDHHALVIISSLSSLPYWKSPTLRLRSLTGIRATDQTIEKWRTREEGAEFAALLSGYADHLYGIMEFGFEHGHVGTDAVTKPSTIKRLVLKVDRFLNFLYGHGHRDLREAGRMWLSRYMAELNSLPTEGYTISRFYRWAKTTGRFVPALSFTRRHGKSARDKDAEGFAVLTIEQAQSAYQRICAHPDPQARFLAFMSLLYSQNIASSSSIRRADLKRNSSDDGWIVQCGEDPGFELEPEVSATLDECLKLADAHTRFLGQQETDFVLPGRIKHHLSPTVTGKKIKAASGHSAEILRRTGVVNMFRSGQKTMGTIVLRDQLKVSVPTIQRAIKVAGHSVNAPMDRDAAEAYRRAFLEQDD